MVITPPQYDATAPKHVVDKDNVAQTMLNNHTAKYGMIYAYSINDEKHVRLCSDIAATNCMI
jgi:hypothetical protein